MDLLEEYMYPHKKETFNIIGAAMEVHTELGNGFLEAVYQEALSIIFQEKDIPFEQEKILEIYFLNKKLNKKYIADFVCYDKIIVELKAVSELNNNHLAQVLNYLKATGYKVGLLINFGKESLEFRRVVR